ncbi:MAG: 8-amino-7-oxononanoate synthase [Methylocystaceae bacterium]|nr:MAG: 8-amino-7-oxononanoate synthase [Methylocystaceae bacterium]
MNQLAKFVSSICPATQNEAPPRKYGFRFDQRYNAFNERKNAFARLGIADPFFVPHDGVNNSTTKVDGREFINFASYNYLGLSGNKRVEAAAKAAIDRYGTSVSASRVVSGEIPLHRELELALANFLGAEDSVLYVGGHAANVSTIGHLFGQNDLILCDALIHNSIVEGCKLSGARRLSFRHNDLSHLEKLLQKHRPHFERVLIAIEGVYSMDGDIPDLPHLIDLKKKYDAALMVDEAHSLGVLGSSGRGVGEHFGVDPRDVDIWMGTLSKSLASCGGYIAGSREIIEFLKYTSPGFVFSVGMTPANVGAALAALKLLEEQPRLVETLQQRAALFLESAKSKGLDTGSSGGTPIVPVVIGDSALAVQLTQRLLLRGISVHPIIYPAVENHAARLRFFIAADHSEEQISYSVATTAEEYDRLRAGGRA